MTLKDLLEEYLDGKRDAISVIRTLSGMFDPANATDLLVLICAVTRIEQGDLDKDTFRSVWLGEKDDNMA
jgi:hypothetical protein